MTRDARSARRQAVLAARADATVRGPVLAPLRCSCVVSDDGGVWSPCPEIAAIHAAAMTLVRQGVQPRRLMRDERGIEVVAPDTLAVLQDAMAAHVEAGERAAHGPAEQAVML